jgi:hypothetical protein
VRLDQREEYGRSSLFTSSCSWWPHCGHRKWRLIRSGLPGIDSTPYGTHVWPQPGHVSGFSRSDMPEQVARPVPSGTSVDPRQIEAAACPPSLPYRALISWRSRQEFDRNTAGTSGSVHHPHGRLAVGARSEYASTTPPPPVDRPGGRIETASRILSPEPAAAPSRISRAR